MSTVANAVISTVDEYAKNLATWAYWLAFFDLKKAGINRTLLLFWPERPFFFLDMAVSSAHYSPNGECD